MQRYAYTTLQSWIQTSQVLEKDSFGPKVILRENGQIVKIFRRKRLISSALFYPYSKRFFNNAKRLTELGIATVQPKTLFTIPKTCLTGVIYQPLQGETLYDLYQKGRLEEVVSHQRFAEFINWLHNLGVYFRSLHLGNVVLTPDNDLGLIDIADLYCKRRNLTANERRRNFQHLHRFVIRANSTFNVNAVEQAYNALQTP